MGSWILCTRSLAKHPVARPARAWEGGTPPRRNEHVRRCEVRVRELRPNSKRANLSRTSGRCNLDGRVEIRIRIGSSPDYFNSNDPLLKLVKMPFQGPIDDVPQEIAVPLAVSRKSTFARCRVLRMGSRRPVDARELR